MSISVAQAQLFFLAFTRVMVILIQIPYFNASYVPNQFRIAFGIILTMMILPWQPLAVDAVGLSMLEFGMALLQELIIGLLAGFGAVLIFGAFQTAGKLLELSSGFGSGQLFNPTLGDTGSAYDQIFIMTALIYFLVIDGHHLFIMGIKQTFDVLPLNSAIPVISVERLLGYTATLMVSAVQIALPVMAAILLTDFTLGLLAKVAPQIQVFFLGLPAKIGIALFALMLSFQIMLPVMGEMVGKIGKYMLGLLGA